MLFKKILDESNRKPNKIWVDKCSEFYNRSMKSFLQNNNIGMYSTHNDGKSVSSIQHGGIETFCTLRTYFVTWVIFWSEGIETFLD